MIYAVSTKDDGNMSDYDDSDPTSKELLSQAAKSFEMENNEDEGVFWDETNLKPLKLKK